MQKKYHRIVIRLDEALAEKLKALAKKYAQGNISYLMRDYIITDRRPTDETETSIL